MEPISNDDSLWRAATGRNRAVPGVTPDQARAAAERRAEARAGRYLLIALAAIVAVIALAYAVDIFADRVETARIWCRMGYMRDCGPLWRYWPDR